MEILACMNRMKLQIMLEQHIEHGEAKEGAGLTHHPVGRTCIDVQSPQSGWGRRPQDVLPIIKSYFIIMQILCFKYGKADVIYVPEIFFSVIKVNSEI